MNVPFVDLHAQYLSLKSEIDAAIAEVIAESAFIRGRHVERFEKAWAKTLGVKHCVSCANGTDALYIAIRALGVKPGDEVITTAHSWISTSETITQAGGRVVFCDTDNETFTIDPALIEAKITSATVGIIPVHLYGQPADMDPIMAIARKHNLWVIEDSAQAHTAKYKGQVVGTFGNAATFSFYPGKNLGAYGDAGAVTGHDSDLLSRIRRMRDHGRTTKYEHVEVGYAERIDALQAAILAAKLPHLEAWNEARRRHARSYGELLGGGPVALPVEAAGMRHVYHLYVVRHPNRDALLAHLKANGIAAGVHYPIPLHRQLAYANLGYGDVSLPETERAANEVLSLPMFPEITDEQLGFVVEIVRDFFKRP